jgi:hypothetical protein
MLRRMTQRPPIFCRGRVRRNILLCTRITTPRQHFLHRPQQQAAPFVTPLAGRSALLADIAKRRID